MNLPSLTLLMTVHNRMRPVLAAVLDSLKAQDVDEMIIVADRPTDEARAAIPELLKAIDKPYRIVQIEGPPGWLGPAKAWNAGINEVKTETVMMISSETIQGADNIAICKEVLSKWQGVVFGQARCSVDNCPEVTWTDGAPSHLLTDAAHPRPLGFVMALPTWMLRATGGFDEKFMDGFCFDDDDLMYRLWTLRRPFMFNDLVTGVHQHHERPDLTPEGIERNRAYICAKYGIPEPHPLDNPLVRQGLKQTGEPPIVLWQHRCGRCATIA